MPSFHRGWHLYIWCGRQARYRLRGSGRRVSTFQGGGDDISLRIYLIESNELSINSPLLRRFNYARNAIELTCNCPFTLACSRLLHYRLNDISIRFIISIQTAISRSHISLSVYNSYPYYDCAVYITIFCILKNLKPILYFLPLTLMLLMANFANTKNAKKLNNDWNPGNWVLIWEYSVRAIQRIPTWHGLDGFQKSLHSCASDESSLSIRRVN